MKLSPWSSQVVQSTALVKKSLTNWFKSAVAAIILSGFHTNAIAKGNDRNSWFDASTSFNSQVVGILSNDAPTQDKKPKWLIWELYNPEENQVTYAHTSWKYWDFSIWEHVSETDVKVLPVTQKKYPIGILKQISPHLDHPTWKGEFVLIKGRRDISWEYPKKPTEKTSPGTYSVTYDGIKYEVPHSRDCRMPKNKKQRWAEIHNFMSPGWEKEMDMPYQSYKEYFLDKCVRWPKAPSRPLK